MMYPKPPKPLVSRALRDSARGKPCSLRWSSCSSVESVVLAHIRGTWSGLGQKPNDTFAVFACRLCHDCLDGRAGPPVPPREIIRALYETQAAMLADGLIKVKGAA